MAAVRKPQPRFDVDENARVVVKMLMAQTGMEVADLAELLEVSETTAYQKLGHRRPSPFKLAEVYRLALRFGVPVEVFTRPPALVGTQPTTRELAQKPLTTRKTASASTRGEKQTHLTTAA